MQWYLIQCGVVLLTIRFPMLFTFLLPLVMLKHFNLGSPEMPRRQVQS